MIITCYDYEQREFKEGSYIVYCGTCMIDPTIYQISEIFERIIYYEDGRFKLKGIEYLVKLDAAFSFGGVGPRKIVEEDQLSDYKLLSEEEVERIKALIGEFEHLRRYNETTKNNQP